MKKLFALPHTVQVATSLITSLTENGKGMMGTAFPHQPEKSIKLYEMEGCPFCRRVREVITLLNLDVEIYPCPKGGTRYRPLVKNAKGKGQFPFLIDENTGDKIFESNTIIAHLFKHYGVGGKVPNSYRTPKAPILGIIGSVVRSNRGVKVDKSIATKTAPVQLLELWGFEASPFTRLVRERLCELELAHISHTVAKERWQDLGPAVLRLKPGKYEPLKGGKRDVSLDKMQGRMQVPYLVDPNTGVSLFESKAIIAYLNRQYGG